MVDQNTYVPLYHSNMMHINGCSQKILDKEGDSRHFPSVKTFACDICDEEHEFRLHTTYFANGKSKKDNILAWAESRNIKVM